MGGSKSGICLNTLSAGQTLTQAGFLHCLQRAGISTPLLSSDIIIMPLPKGLNSLNLCKEQTISQILHPLQRLAFISIYFFIGYALTSRYGPIFFLTLG